MVRKVLSNTVGARNPYAVAELKLHKKINWRKKTPESKIRILEKAFERPYHELFDPRFSNSLFPQKTDPRFEQILSGAGDTVSCVPNPCPAIENWTPVTSGKITPDAVSYDDLVQGCLPDCYFISALSALAWALQTKGRFQTNVVTYPYKYTFYSPKRDAAGSILLNALPGQDSPVYVDDKIPVLKPEIKIYSRSNTAIETWPCLYEKAYAAWQHCKKFNLDPADTTIKPDYIHICQGNPVTALMHLTGKIPTYFYTSGMTGATIYNYIGSQASPLPASPVIRLQTNYPAVAWTHNPSDPTDVIPANVFYRDDVIVANHSYTVLGTSPLNGKKYIVLRNPWGQKSGDPIRGILADPAFATGSWLGKKLEDPADGIFALDADVFQQYFAGFGWVK
jgi:hypothetical protein